MSPRVDDGDRRHAAFLKESERRLEPLFLSGELSQSHALQWLVECRPECGQPERRKGAAGQPGVWRPRVWARGPVRRPAGKLRGFSWLVSTLAREKLWPKQT